MSDGHYCARDVTVEVMGLSVVDVEWVLGPCHGYEDRST